MNDIFQWYKAISPYGWPVVIFVGIIYIFLYFLFHPEKIETWEAILARIGSYVSERSKRVAVTSEAQAKINSFIVEVSLRVQHIDPIGAKIKWISPGETREVFFEEGDVVICLEQGVNNNRNIARAAHLFIGKVFLSKPKRYMSKSQKTSLDAFVTSRFLEEKASAIADEFFVDLFQPAVDSSKKVANLVEDYNLLDKAGAFFSLFVQELTFLGEKVIHSTLRNEVVIEVNGLLNFLKNYSNRVAGDETVPLEYSGKHCKCAIMIVARGTRVSAGEDPQPWVNYIEKCISEGCENMYLLGNVRYSSFIDGILESVRTNSNIEVYSDRVECAEFLIRKDEWKPVKDRFVLLRNKSVQRYIGKS